MDNGRTDRSAEGAGRSRGTSIDEMLERAMAVINRGDRTAAAPTCAADSAGRDEDQPIADELMSGSDPTGEIRRLTLMFVDLVDSTVLSTQVEPETYWLVVGRYRDQVTEIINAHGGHIGSTKGDGLLAVFGHPIAHEDDARRAVAAGLEITRAVRRLSALTQRRFGVAVSARVGVHRGLVYLDLAQDDVYGFGANLASRISGLAQPDTVAVSDAVAGLVGDAYELDTRPPAPVKGVAEPVSHHLVLEERQFAPPSHSAPLVGRDREHGFLEAAWQQALEGQLTTCGVALRGEPGIGKTRLAREAADLVRASGGNVVELRGSPLHSQTGLYPVRRLLERRCSITRLTEGAVALRLLDAELRSTAMDPAETNPLLAPVLGIAPEHGYRPAALEGRALYETIGAAVHRYLLACLGDGPGLLIAEDVHWFDPSTREVLDRVFSTADGRLLVVLTGRDGEWMKQEWPVTAFRLEPLTDPQADALIAALHPTVTDAQRAAVRRRCDGVPFYIEHVVAALDTASPEAHVPEAVHEPLFARLYTRPDVVPVIEAAAVIGRGGDTTLLRSVVGDDTDVDAIVGELVRAGVLEAAPSGTWRFRHELLREVAAELAPPSRRRHVHARVAHALVDAAAGADPDWGLVAAHFEQADRYEDAVRAHRQASVAARRRGALGEALARITAAVEGLSHGPAGAARDRTELELRLERGYLAGLTQGSWSGEGPAEFERCLALASDGGHEDELFTALTALIGYYLPRAELRRAGELLDSLSSRVTKERPWSVPSLAASLGAVLWLQGEFKTARTHLERALSHRSAADPRDLDTAWRVPVDPISSALNYLAVDHITRGDLDGADAALRASVRRCDELDFPQNAHNRSHTHFMEIWVRLESGQLTEAADQIRQLRRHAERTGLDVWLWVGATENATVKALTALRDGADADVFAETARKLADRVDTSRRMNLKSYLTFHDAVIGRLLIAAGQPEPARDRLEMSLQHADETGMHFYDAEVMRMRARTLTTPDARLAALIEAAALARAQGATLFELRCALDAFALTSGGDRAVLADLVARFRPDHRWREYVTARDLLG